MDWDDLRTFLAIARHRTLTGSAKALGVTQPTMGRRLAALEARHGARLLQRMPGGYALTPLGEGVLIHAERIEAEALAAERAILGRDAALAGTVRITTVDVLAPYVVVPAIAELRTSHPGISVELVPDMRLLSLSRREADIALRPSRFDSHEVHARRVGRIAMGIYAARSLIDSDRPRQIVTTLEDQAHLPEAKWLHTLYPDAGIALRSNSREVQLQAALAGMGLTVLARFRADREPGLVLLHDGGAAQARDLWLGVHADMRQMPRVRAVMDAVAAEIARQAEVLAPAC